MQLRMSKTWPGRSKRPGQRETSEAYIEAVEEKHQQEKRVEYKRTIRKWIADNAVALVALAVAILK